MMLFNKYQINMVQTCPAYYKSFFKFFQIIFLLYLETNNLYPIGNLVLEI